MLIIKTRHLSLAAASLLVIFAFDFPRQFIEIYNLSLPRLGGNPPYLVPFVIVLAAAYLRLLEKRMLRQAVSGIDVMFLLVIALWVFLEVHHGATENRLNFRLVSDNFWFFLTYYVARLHLSVFDEADLIKATIAISVVVCAAHAVLLLLIQTGMNPLGAYVPEVIDRNGLSFFLTATLFLHWFVRSSGAGRLQSYGLPVFTAAYVFLNHSRGAQVVFLFLAAIKLGVAWSARRMAVARSAFLLSLVAAVVITGGYGWMVARGWLPDISMVQENSVISDDIRSNVYRMAANNSLVNEFQSHPLLGIGGDRVSEIRAGGYMSHTYFLLPLVAYGLLGFIPYVLFCGALIFRMRARQPELPYLASAFLLAVACFVNDLWGWFGLLIAILQVPVKVRGTLSLKGRFVCAGE